MEKDQQEIIQEPTQTVRDPADGQLKTSIPNPHELKKEEEIKESEDSNA